MDAIDPRHHPLARKLESIFPLSDEERAAIVGLEARVRNLDADQQIVSEGDQPSECCLVKGSLAATRSPKPESGRFFPFTSLGTSPTSRACT